MTERFRLQPGLLLATVALAGCASLLGIDDLSLATDAGQAGAGSPGSGGANGGGLGSGADAGRGGAFGERGGTSSGGDGLGAGGSAASGGTPGSGGVEVGGSVGASGRKGAAGAVSSGGSGAVSGDAGEAGAGAPSGGAGEGGTGGGDTTVHGTVIDVWGHRLASIPVAIGDDTILTGSDGTFTFQDVPATYTASLVVQWLNGRDTDSAGWIYQGLTLRNPTLQVYRAFSERSVQLYITPENAAFDANSSWLLAFGSPDGNNSLTADEHVSNSPLISWEGPIANTWTVHGLVVESMNYEPTGYSAYDSTQQSVTAGNGAPVTLDLGKGAVPSDYVSGSVTAADPTDRSNYPYVRFTSGATIPLTDGGVSPSGPSFQYLVPSLSDASIIMAASSGFMDYNGYAIAHRDGLAPGATNVAIDIPGPPSITQPADGATNVRSGATFSFKPSQTGVAHVVQLYADQDNSDIFLVTSQTSFTLADFEVPNGLPILPNTLYDWQVQSHGTPPTVDAMCGQRGFIDEFSAGLFGPPALYPNPSNTSGSFTFSTRKQFTTAP